MWCCQRPQRGGRRDARHRPGAKRSPDAYLVNVKQSDLQAGKYNVILGEQLAGQLGVNRGDQIRVMVPSQPVYPDGAAPSQRLFNVIGTFAASSEVDGYQMLTNIDDASRLMRYPREILPAGGCG